VKKLLLAFFFTSLFFFLAHSFFTKTSVFADAKFYFSYTHSFVFNRKLLLGNEFYTLGVIKNIPPSGFVTSFYPPGVSIFWIPFFYFTYGLLTAVKLFFSSTQVTGYEAVFEYACGITNILLGISGLYLTYRTLKRYFSEKVCQLTVSALFLTTNLFFYIAVEPINSHATSFFTSALFLFYFLGHRQNKHFYFILGVIAGIAGLVRTQDLLLVLIPLVDVLVQSSSRKNTQSKNIFYLASGVFLGFLPQILLWKYFYNTFWYSPYFKTGFDFLHPKIFHVLSNSQNGLFTITPATAAAFIGLLIPTLTLLFKSHFQLQSVHKSLQVKNNVYFLSLIYFLIQLLLVSSWNDYTQGGSYSIRMVITTYPLLSFGLANIINKIKSKIGVRKISYIIGGFTMLNFLLILNYLLKY